MKSPRSERLSVIALDLIAPIVCVGPNLLGARFEPASFGLWARISASLLTVDWRCSVPKLVPRLLEEGEEPDQLRKRRLPRRVLEYRGDRI